MTGGACRLAPDAANQPADSAGITTFTEALGIGPPGLGLSSQPAVTRPMQNRRTKAVLLMRRMLCPLPCKSSRTPRRAAADLSGGSWPLAAVQPALDVFEHIGQIGDAVDHVVGARGL